MPSHFHLSLHCLRVDPFADSCSCRGRVCEQEVGYWPLYCAALNGHVDVMRMLIEVGHADVNQAGVSVHRVFSIVGRATGGLAVRSVAILQGLFDIE
jgi:hypothetical protein